MHCLAAAAMRGKDFAEWRESLEGTMAIAHFVVWRKLPFWLAAFYTVCTLVKLCLDFAYIRFQGLTVLFPD